VQVWASQLRETYNEAAVLNCRRMRQMVLAAASSLLHRRGVLPQSSAHPYSEIRRGSGRK
jgi:hypothetical protein